MSYVHVFIIDEFVLYTDTRERASVIVTAFLPHISFLVALLLITFLDNNVLLR